MKEENNKLHNTDNSSADRYNIYKNNIKYLRKFDIFPLNKRLKLVMEKTIKVVFCYSSA